MRAVWPWQKWALASSNLDQRDEIAARTLGVLTILDLPVDWQSVREMAQAIHRRAASAATAERPLVSAVRASSGRSGLSDAPVTSTLLQP
jgi:hypothetical protein